MIILNHRGHYVERGSHLKIELCKPTNVVNMHLQRPCDPGKEQAIIEMTFDNNINNKVMIVREGLNKKNVFFRAFPE